MRPAIAMATLILAFVLGTLVGWWMVPVIALFWSLLPPARSAVRPALAAAAGWALWLGYDLLAGGGGLGRLAGRLSGLMQLPSPVLILLTLVFPALLAACAASIGGGLGAAFSTRRARPSR
jgi:hypothetical protein